jgi:uncharacterized protein (DUF885 family)
VGAAANPHADAAERSAADVELQKLLDDAWEFALKEDPLLATSAGDRRYDDRLPDVSRAAIERRAAADREFLKRLEAIDRAALSPAERVNYDIFRRLKRDDLAEYEFRAYLMPITNRSGFHIEFAELPQRMALQTIADYENYIARLRGFQSYARAHIELLREAIRQGFVLPAVVLRDCEQPIEAQIVTEPDKSRLYEPLRDIPAIFPPAERQRLDQAAREAIVQSVVPGYAEFLEFMTKEYVPAARGEIGAWALPNGREYYRFRVRQFSTLEITPEEVHALGQSEVRRIRKEMAEVIKRTGFQGDFRAFVEHLRTEPRFYADSPEALMKEVALVLKKMDGQLPRLFKTLPRSPYGILPVPDYIAPRTTTAYYQPPPGDGSRAAVYFVNTYNLKTRPLYEVEALSLHEAVPGHHLQIALQQELGELPRLRRFHGFTVFVEGWALYAERLGLECGFYQDPYSDFGRLSYEAWRACRLVVDTGMHYLGWSRQQAIDFMAENTALTLLNITNEVDRYISWPGQALAYKLGELKIRELRKVAEEKLGPGFDVREFHDVVLLAGSVPLDVLEQNVSEYIERKK